MQAVRDKILANVAMEPNTGCWLWTGLLTSKGYARMRIGREQRGHRHSFDAFKGPIAAGMYVCHACDVRSCVNPEHLWLGTNADNMRDMVGKRRLGMIPPPKAVSRRSARAKLSPDQVRTIRAGRESINQLARRFGVSHGAVHRARRFVTYRHVA